MIGNESKLPSSEEVLESFASPDDGQAFLLWRRVLLCVGESSVEAN